MFVSFVLYSLWLVLKLMNCLFVKFKFCSLSSFLISVKLLSLGTLLLCGISLFHISSLNSSWVMDMKSGSWSHWVTKTLHFVYHQMLREIEVNISVPSVVHHLISFHVHVFLLLRPRHDFFFLRGAFINQTYTSCFSFQVAKFLGTGWLSKSL